ncbi:hypothetical protein IFO69_10680 [Echinicola sp. CAU 1574]|uniref:HTH luxR-type domain-containing protein n=1 Tax=Echinicola arenosa TaxID=2774144 RepID=A0ABR9AK68_9BACT|nr:LuxR C-terminal-related transcriptional regulator [Echinicola arenosa]MBD8489210.1 hypothetical protein [Echinicola arenosa]
MNNSASINKDQTQGKLAAFEMVAKWLPGIKIIQQIDPNQNLFICEKGIQHYGLSPAFFKHLPTREFEKIIFSPHHQDTCFLGTREGQSLNERETKLYLQRKVFDHKTTMELVLVKKIFSENTDAPLLQLIQIIPIKFQSWAMAKMERVIQEMNFKKANYKKFNLLTERNKEVLAHMVSCCKAEEISEMLGISVNTVNTHKKKIKDLLVLEESHEVLWYGLAFDLLSY